jgi:hypothetical protein
MLTPPYRILHYRGYRCLLCLACNRMSWHPNDIRQKYCGYCQVFLNDLPEMLRQDTVEGPAPGLLLGHGDPTLPAHAADEGTGFNLTDVRRIAGPS